MSGGLQKQTQCFGSLDDIRVSETLTPLLANMDMGLQTNLIQSEIPECSPDHLSDVLHTLLLMLRTVPWHMLPHEDKHRLSAVAAWSDTPRTPPSINHPKSFVLSTVEPSTFTDRSKRSPSGTALCNAAIVANVDHFVLLVVLAESRVPFAL